MNTDRLYQLFRAAFPGGATGWTEPALGGAISAEGAIVALHPYAFAIGRVVLDEAELFLVGTDPSHRRAGLGARVLEAFEASAQEAGARRVFLEVGARNSAAQGLYKAAGYFETGRRPDYYRHPNGDSETALLLAKPLRGA